MRKKFSKFNYSFLSTMKLIFLDIDGVLNSAMGKGPYISDMEAEKLLLLKKLIDNSGATGIVITSDRRYSEIDMKNKISAFSKYNISVTGTTRFPNQDDFDDNRGKQILDYLSALKEDVERIAILDDNDEGISDLFFEEYIQINRFYGFNSEAYEKALKALT